MIRVAIGTEPRTEPALAVLQYSIRKRCSRSVEFTPLSDEKFRIQTDTATGTGFSFARWLIPEHFDWEGLAIYLDADQLVLGDLWQLLDDCLPPIPAPAFPGVQPVIWTTWQEHPDPPVKPQTSVMVIDCARAKLYPGFQRAEITKQMQNATRAEYHAFMRADWIRQSIGALPPCWNHMDKCERGKSRGNTQLIHFTSVPRQPWNNPGHKLAKLWKDELALAVREQEITQRQLRSWLESGYLHKSYRDLLT